MRSSALPSKPHYPILDGLRGVAALVVVIFHICEAHLPSHVNQPVNHGCLAVDFFFLLSGFVIGYAYDDRWKEMTLIGFFKRRLIRLQPMVIVGSVIGAACFYFQDSALWPQIHTVPVWKVIGIMFIGCTLVPILPRMDIRGLEEMHPLNGAAWSLFWEYVGNFLYAVFLRKLSRAALTILVLLSAVLLIQYGLTAKTGDMTGGWSIKPLQVRIGMTRLLFPFLAGLLMSRTIKPRNIPHAFFWCSLLLIVFLSLPRLGGETHFWMNGLYESLTIIFIFPLVLYLGAGGKLTNALSTRVCRFLGDISYPIYITHYPLIYVYTGWASNHPHVGFWGALPYATALFVGSVGIAYASLKWYDEPVRRWLQKRFQR